MSLKEQLIHWIYTTPEGNEKFFNHTGTRDVEGYFADYDEPGRNLTEGLAKDLGFVLKKSKVETDLDKRWEEGIEHHPKSIALAERIAELDEEYGNDTLYLKFGGDGDNGEHLMYLLDIYFEMEDEQNDSK